MRVDIYLMVSLGVEKILGFTEGRKNGRSDNRKGEPYANPVDVKTLL